MIVATIALPVMAQATPLPGQSRPDPAGPGSWAGAADQHRYQVDQHRYEIDRLRAQADQRETFARQLELETRLNRQRLEAARRPEAVRPATSRSLGSPPEEQALRRSASERRATTTSDVGQIDAWLDRPRD